jgi:hypothetical protein
MDFREGTRLETQNLIPLNKVPSYFPFTPSYTIGAAMVALKSADFVPLP